MRDIDRIDDILGTIRFVWKKNPDLRLCQLISNCFHGQDIYYIEDEELNDKLVKLYKEE